MAGVRRTVVALGVAVHFVRVVVPVRLDIVAVNNGQRNTTDGVARAIVAVLGGGLLAHVGRLGRAFRGRLGGHGSGLGDRRLGANSSASRGDRLSRARATMAGLFLNPPIQLVAVLASVTGLAVASELLAPVGKVIAVQTVWVTSLVEA